MKADNPAIDCYDVRLFVWTNRGISVGGKQVLTAEESKAIADWFHGFPSISKEVIGLAIMKIIQARHEIDTEKQIAAFKAAQVNQGEVQ